MEKFVFAYSSEENGFTIEEHECKTFDEAKEMYIEALAQIGEEDFVNDECTYEGCDDEFYCVSFGAFDKNAPEYTKWLDLMAENRKAEFEEDDDDEDEEIDAVRKFVNGMVNWNNPIYVNTIIDEAFSDEPDLIGHLKGKYADECNYNLNWFLSGIDKHCFETFVRYVLKKD